MVLGRIGLLGPVLSYRPGRRAELEALLGSLPWLFDLHVVPASSIVWRRDAEPDDGQRDRDASVKGALPHACIA